MGYVYLIGTPTFGWYKIGKSITPEVRIKDLGILLPFKIEVIAVWEADNHHNMEKAMHELYAANKINGEWFEFNKKEIQILISKIPESARASLNEKVVKFTNIAEDLKLDKKIIGVKVQKLRGNFTPEEREAKRIAAIEQQRQKKLLKASQQQ